MSRRGRLAAHASFDAMDGFDDGGLGFVLDLANDDSPGFPLHQRHQRPLSGLQSSNDQINFPVAEFLLVLRWGWPIMDAPNRSRDPFSPATQSLSSLLVPR